MKILGISCFYHDAAACLLEDGRIIAAAQEERFTRRKNSPDFPLHAINYCLQQAQESIYGIDCVGFYEKPYLKFSRMVQNHVMSFPFSFRHFLRTMPSWLEDRLILPMVLKRELGFGGQTFFIKHHLSHAASAFLVSPFSEAAILTADAVGEWATTAGGEGRGSDIRIRKEIHFPDSLGLLYTAFTTFLGFQAHEGEGKVMGLAGYGKPSYRERFKDVICVKEDGSYRLNQRYFGFFNEGSAMYTQALCRAFGKPRKPDEPVTERYCDIAATLQKVTEDVLVKMARALYKETRHEAICLAGGLFLNCVANHKILEETPFKRIFIQPAAGDSGGALGVASYLYHCLFGKERNYVMREAALGPAFSNERIRRFLSCAGVPYKEMAQPDLCRSIARKIADGQTVGWFRGRMEFGPRALGNRSILANPCNPRMKDFLNAKIKHRESFRPYAPAVKAERARDFFELGDTSAFMLLAARVKEDKKQLIPAVTHVDGTARIQTVDKEVDGVLWQLIHEFECITGVPMVLNTSFNVADEPIVCTPEDAFASYKKSTLDCLVLENFVVEQ